jgi:hypothetical protein
MNMFRVFLGCYSDTRYFIFGVSVCSDKPGQHDFNLLKKLVLPDGSILRAKLPGRPTRDCLFSDPARDGKR